MSNTVFTKRMPAGVPGSISRPHEASTEPQTMDSAAPVPAFGYPVKISGNKIAAIAAGDTAADVYGFLVRIFPATSGSLEQDFDSAVPVPHGLHPVMTRGYINVLCAAGTAAKNGAVYMRVAAGAGNAPVGRIEAAEIPGETVAIPNCIFTGPVDENSITEVRFWR